MVMKVKINKAEYEKLSAEFQAEYAADGEDFALSISGMEDTGSLKRAKDNEVNARKAAEQQVRDLTAKLEEAGMTHADAVKAAEAKGVATVEKLTNFARATLLDSVATKMAADLSDSPALLMPHIRSRLAADLDGDTPSTKVLDASGKATKLSVAELQAEFVANKDFSAIIRGSKASGGGAAQKPNNGGAGQRYTPNNSDAPADLSKMPAADMVARIQANKAAASNQ